MQIANSSCFLYAIPMSLCIDRVPKSVLQKALSPHSDVLLSDATSLSPLSPVFISLTHAAPSPKPTPSSHPQSCYLAQGSDSEELVNCLTDQPATAEISVIGCVWGERATDSSQTFWVQISALPVSSYLTLGKLLNISVFQLPPV